MTTGNKLDKWLEKELFWNSMLFNLVRGIVVFGFVLLTLFFVLVTGAIAVEGFDAPSLVGGDRRAETFAYGLGLLVLASVVTKNVLFKFWRLALEQLQEARASNVASIHRAARCSPAYYR